MISVIERERIVAVIPIRSFRNGKTRLAPVLDRKTRESLLIKTATDVVIAVRDSGCIDSVVVVSADADVLAWAERLGSGVVALPQPSSLPGLNGAIAAGRDWAIAAGSASVLSVFADLPFLSRADVHLLAARREPVVLGPDRHGQGTNALLLRLAGRGKGFRFAFGEGSLTRHREEARRLGLDAGIVRAAGIAFDLDTPGDWTDYLAVQSRWAEDAEPLLLSCGAGAG